MENFLISVRDVEGKMWCEVKRKFCPKTSHEDTDGEQRYGSTLSLTSELVGGGGVVNATTRPLYPRERNHVPLLEEAGWAPGTV